MSGTHPRVGIPARLAAEDGSRDHVADDLFDRITAELRSVGVDVVVVNDESEDLDDLDGFVIPGGGDLDPILYGQAGSKDVQDVNPEQDSLDLHVLEAAEYRSKPLLAICRGAQLLNVHRGGTLHTDLPQTEVTHRDRDAVAENEIWVWHEVGLDSNSALAREYGSSRMRVASAHHQGIRDVGSGLKVIAMADDGLVEGVQGTDPAQWVLGIQWHPEFPGVDDRVRSVPFELFAEQL